MLSFFYGAQRIYYSLTLQYILYRGITILDTFSHGEIYLLLLPPCFNHIGELVSNASLVVKTRNSASEVALHGS